MQSPMTMKDGNVKLRQGTGSIINETLNEDKKIYQISNLHEHEGQETTK
jgi:hypothetical protein